MKRRRLSNSKLSRVERGDDDEIDTQESHTVVSQHAIHEQNTTLPVPESDSKLGITGSVAEVADANSGGATTKIATSGRIPARNRPSGCLQTPHTMRLLKLIREGSAEYANMAVERLSFTCTSSATSPIQLWDLLGRLQAFLSAPEWATRQVAAQAIYVVAHHLPVEDQYQFLTSTSGFHRDPNEEEVIANDEQNQEYLTVQDLLLENDARWGHGRSGMDTVLTEGLELFSQDESRFSRNVVVPTTNENISSLSVALRVRHQRRLLAMRLGLSVMTDVIGDEDRTNGMVPLLTQDDLPMEQSGNDIRQQHSRRIQDANLPSESSVGDRYKMDVQDALEMEPQNPHSIRALLVREISSNHGEPSKISRHRNPQFLLANELLYCMFDPIWYVRHGALLGILSLLRAWTKSYRSISGLNHGESDPVGESHLFGVWPHDLLARCLCVLALDRFGDFAGGNIDQGSDTVNGITPTLTSLNTSVVAPVREICGQTVGVLHSMAPSRVAEQTRQVLLHMCHCEKSWEVRHGALIALKYIAVVETRGLLPELGSIQHVSYSAGIHDLSNSGVLRLSDCSDDVKSASAHLLLEIFSGTGTVFSADVVPALWNSLQSVRPVSSCIVDLVSLLTLLVNRDCALVLRNMSARISLDGCTSNYDAIPLCSINNMVLFLVKLLDSDFCSVRISSLHSVGLVMRELSKSHFLEHWDDHSFQSFAKTLQEVAACIFYLFRRSSDIESDSEFFPTNALHSTWSHISDACVKLLNQNQKEMLSVLLLTSYFKIEDTDVLEETNVLPCIQSANALAYYLSESENTLVMNDIVPSALVVYLHSPAPLQCESACLLYKALATRHVRWSSLEAFESALDVEMVFPCLVATRCSSMDTVVSSSVEVLPVKKFSYCLSGGYMNVWTKLLPMNQQNECRIGDGIVCPLNSMRVSATLAGAVLSKGLPSKLTPIVRALVTFFNNECVSRSRATLVAEYITELLTLLASNPKFERARLKVLDTVCDAVTYRSCGGLYNEFRVFLAKRILRSFVNNLSQMISFRDIPPFWLRLLPISRLDEAEGVNKSASVLDSIDLLDALIDDTCVMHRSVQELVDSCTSCLLHLAFTSMVAQERAIWAMVTFLRISPDNFLRIVIPLLNQELQNRKDDQRRFSACKILLQLVEAAGAKFSSFVRMLLPIVLSLMSDNMVECAECATATFALLVKIAPLVRPMSSEDKCISKNHRESVIDHLIFGKPLPSFKLPNELSNSLRDKGIVLRNYQNEGVTWLQFLQSVNLNGALCDDMGTGKSLQALVAISLAHIMYKRRSKNSLNISHSMETDAPFRSLIVCPATLVGQWDGEIIKCFPPQTIFTSLCLAGSRVERFQKWSSISDSVNIVIVSYSVLRSDIDYLESQKWCYCVLDEGHLLKNPKTATALASRRLTAQHKLVLTGTLIQNRIHELWATFDFLMPGFLGTSKAFVTNFANPISRSQLATASASDIAIGIARLKQLHQQVLPFILRREKNQVLSELPRMSQTVVHVPMSRIQKNIYNEFCAEKASHILIDKMEELLCDPNPLAGMSKDVLKSLLFLRLLCTHPSLVLTRQQQARCPASYFSVNASGKMLALADILRTALQCDDNFVGADGDSSVFYEDKSSEDQEERLDLLDTRDPWLGDMVSFESDLKRTESSQTSKCLIFAQFTKSLDVVEDVILKTLLPSVRYVRLDGTVSPDRRMNIVDLFQQDPNVKVLLLTTRVGGIGLNLTAANIVIFLEIDFNPYADFQAQDRCMRIGQTKHVNVYRIVTQESVEEKILELQNKKVVVTEAIVNNDNSTLFSLGTDRLLDVFTLDDRNDDRTNDHELKFEYDLDSIVEQCSVDYKSLSVDFFARTLVRSQEPEISER